jgi:predicted metal-dependent phosphoesterase TrpH
VVGDFHVHVDVSGDARSSLEEMARRPGSAARARLAITDHVEGTRSGVGREALLALRAEVRVGRR